MANSIGSYQAHRIMAGEVDPLGLETALETRPGVSGYDSVQVGLRGQPFELETFCDYDSESDMQTAFAVAKGQQGRRVTVVDAYDRSWSNIMVQRVAQPRKQRFLGVAGGATAGLYGLTLRWTLMAV